MLPEVLHALHRLSEPESADEQHHAVVEPEPIPEPEMSLETFDAAVSLEVEGDEPAASSGSIDDISEDEFERLLDELHGGGAPGRQTTAPAPTPKAAPALAVPAGDGDITDDEFEAILDQLHGKGSFIPGQTDTPVAVTAATKVSAPAVPAASSSSSDDISDDEFESLLDELHGKGKAPVAQHLLFKLNRQRLPHQQNQLKLLNLRLLQNRLQRQKHLSQSKLLLLWLRLRQKHLLRLVRIKLPHKLTRQFVLILNA